MSDLIVYEDRPEDDEHESLGRPFRVKARLYNNRLIKAREEMGFKTQVAAAKALGLTQTLICGYESMSKSPWNQKTGTWNKGAQMLADAYGYSPEELWPEVILKVKERYRELEIGSRGFALDPSHEVVRGELAATARKVLATLAPREEKILKARFGIDQEEKTQEEIAQLEDVQQSRIQQLEAKALHKLRGPSRSRSLEVFLPEEDLEVIEKDRMNIEDRRFRDWERFSSDKDEKIAASFEAIHQWWARASYAAQDRFRKKLRDLGGPAWTWQHTWYCWTCGCPNSYTMDKCGACLRGK